MCVCGGGGGVSTAFVRWLAMPQRLDRQQRQNGTRLTVREGEGGGQGGESGGGGVSWGGGGGQVSTVPWTFAYKVAVWLCGSATLVVRHHILFTISRVTALRMFRSTP